MVIQTQNNRKNKAKIQIKRQKKAFFRFMINNDFVGSIRDNDKQYNLQKQLNSNKRKN